MIKNLISAKASFLVEDSTLDAYLFLDSLFSAQTIVAIHLYRIGSSEVWMRTHHLAVFLSFSLSLCQYLELLARRFHCSRLLPKYLNVFQVRLKTFSLNFVAVHLLCFSHLMSQLVPNIFWEWINKSAVERKTWNFPRKMCNVLSFPFFPFSLCVCAGGGGDGTRTQAMSFHRVFFFGIFAIPSFCIPRMCAPLQAYPAYRVTAEFTKGINSLW